MTSNVLTFISMIFFGITGILLVYLLFIKTYYPIKWKIQDWMWSKEKR